MEDEDPHHMTATAVTVVEVVVVVLQGVPTTGVTVFCLLPELLY